MIPFAQWYKSRGISAPRASLLYKAGRFGDSVVVVPHGKTHRYFVVSLEAADAALEATAGGPRFPDESSINRKPATKTTNPTSPEPESARPRRQLGREPTPVSKLDPDRMTKAEAVRLKAVEDALAARIKRQIAEISLLREQGKFADVDAMEAEVEEFMVGLVADLDGAPARFARLCPTATPDQVDCVRLVLNEIRLKVAGEEMTT